MNPLVPLRADPRAPLARANPVAKLAAAGIVMLGLFVSIDILTPVIVLAVLLAAVPATGIRPRDLLSRAWPLLAAAAALTVLNALFAADPSGATLLRIGPLELRGGALLGGLAVGLRVLGVALAGLLVLVATDPTALADALQQQLRFPPRFAVGALAAVRLAPSIALEWQTLGRARRARGVSPGRSPLAAIRTLARQLFSLLVGAVRRATRLAAAMESRGFGSRSCRTVARPQRMRTADWLLIAVGAGVTAGAIGVSVVAGSWRYLFG